MRQRLCLLALILPLALLGRWLPPLAQPKPTKGVRPQPIEAAYGQIRDGMTDKELFALMAPYNKEFTGHYQWQRWTDGQIAIGVYIWPNGGIFTDEPFRVQAKTMFKMAFDDGQERWMPLRSSRLILFPNRRSKIKTAD